MVALAHKKNVGIFRNGKDLDLLQILVSYLTAVRYWDAPDNGMWEEGADLHASSIGACVAGLSLVQKEELAVVPDALIYEGAEALYRILPNETPTRDVDMAQLSLIWPYRVVSDDLADHIVRRIEGKLIQEKGLNRYWDDNYYRSQNGISGEWTMGFFWLSLIESARGNKKKAQMWFDRGVATETEDGMLPELYCDGAPNGNTPLAWSHSMAIIAGLQLIK
jgi:phosphorylase kinase alpha/beta subunit